MDEVRLYTTLKSAASAKIIEKKSVFIGYASPVKDEKEALDFIGKIKELHSDATHNVFGYYIKSGIYARYSDDGEPQGTAGVPVLDVIKKSGIDDAVVVVTRYFGGTLLGAGGLVRAYSSAAREAIEAAGIVTFEEYTECSIKMSYSDHAKLKNELEKFSVITDDCEFSSDVILKIAVKSTLFEELSGKLNELTGGRISAEIIGKRFDGR